MSRFSLAIPFVLAMAACGKTEPPLPPAASAPPATKVYPAAECTKTAAAWFKAAYGEGSKTLADGRVIKASHQPHYNEKRKQCLVRLTADTLAPDKRAPLANVSVHVMGDKPAMIASVVHVREKLTYCVVEGKKCQNVQEWETAAASLMKE